MPSLMASLGLDWSGFRRGMSDARSHAQAEGSSIKSALGDAIGERLAQFGSAAGLEESVRRAVEFGAQIENLSRRLGVGAEALQQWSFALEQNGGTIQDATQFFEKLSVARTQALAGNESMINSFQRLGVSVENLRSDRIEDIALTIARGFESGNPQELIGDLRELGGRSAGALVAAFRDGIPELMKAANDAGAVMDGSMTKSLKEIEDTAKAVWANVRAAFGGTTAFFWENVAKPAAEAARSMLAAIGGFVTGGPRGAVEAVQDFEEGMRIIEAAKDEKRKESGPLSFNVEDENLRREAERKSEASAERIAKLKDQVAAKSAQEARSEMTAAQRILAIERERSDLKRKVAAMSEEDQLKAQLHLIDLDKEQFQAAQDLEREKARERGLMRAEASATEQIGAYNAQPILAQIDVQKRSENHLAAIRADMRILIERLRPGTDVRY